VECLEHRAVAAEHDGEVGISVDDLDAGVTRNRLDARDRVLEAVALADEEARAAYRLT
jgi:hypothetical protein